MIRHVSKSKINNNFFINK